MKSKVGLTRESPLFDDETEEESQFNVGDRVIVDGGKQGTIAFIGEVEFASGDWAGVALDEPEGQHNGTVDGQKYFECEPLHGVFVRPHRLERSSSTGGGARFTARSKVRKSANTDYSTYKTISRDSSIGSGGGGGGATDGAWRSSSPYQRDESPRIKQTKEIRFDDYLPAYSSGRSSVPLSGRDSAASSGSTSSSANDIFLSNLRVGDRVVANSTQGSASGTLRFVGPTSFADGLWAGIELDEANGKNDGSVMGQRYFSCPKNCGLFVPAFKVSKEFPSLTITRVITKTVGDDNGDVSRFGTASPTAYYTKKHDSSTHHKLMSYDSAY